MITITRGLATGIVLAGAAVGLASPAAADAFDGPYLITVTNGRGVVNDGSKQGVFTSPCGPDCTSFNAGTWSADMRLQGNAWNGTTSEGLILSFDKDSLAGTMVKPETGQTVDVQVSKAAL